MKRIEFGSLKIGDTARKHIQDCLDNNFVTMGPKVAQFEKEYSELYGVKHTICVNSGTSADTVAYLSLYTKGAKRGDYIICPALSFISTATAILAAGFQPLFVDIRKEDLLINEELVRQTLETTDKKVVALVAVTTMGKPPKVDILANLCKSHNITFIIDNCEGHFCKYKNKYMHEWADMSTYSFYPAHCLVAGEQGAICTSNYELDQICRSIRSHGREVGSLYFDHKLMGGNFKPLDIIASIGLEGIQNFWENFNQRKNNIRQMREGLDSLSHHFWFSEEDIFSVNAPHAYSIVPKNSNFNHKLFREYLTNNGIVWKLNFNTIQNHNAFNFMEKGYYPESDLAGQGVHWGCHKEISENDIYKLIEIVKDYDYK